MTVPPSPGSGARGPAVLAVLLPAGAAAAGLGAYVLDLAAAVVQTGGPPPGSARLPLACALAAVLAALAWGAARLGLGPAARRAGVPGGALGAGLAAWLLAAQADVVLRRWDAVAARPAAVLASLLVAAPVGLAVLWAAARWRRHRTEAAGARWPGTVARVAFLAALASPLVLGGGAGGDAAPRRSPVRNGHAVPRVLLIVADTLRADALSCQSPDAPPTPALDELARTSWRFARARAPSPWTLPSMCSLLTGFSPLVHRAVDRDSALPPAIPTLAERFAEAGYRTAAFGHNYVLSSDRGLSRGFDEYGFSERRRVPARTLGLLLLRVLTDDEEPELRDADRLGARALRWIDACRDEDFLLWLHYYDPHLEYAPPPDLLPPGPPPPGQGASFGFDAFGRVRSGHDVPDASERAWVRALYEGEVRFLDREVGRLLDGLRARGLFDDTLVVFTSDHGEEFWEHGGFEHGHTTYEELLAVPLLVKLPGQRSGGVVEEPVSLESVAPTLLALAGVGAGQGGEAEAEPLLGPDGRPRAPGAPTLVATGTLYFEDRLALVADGWKYVRWRISGREELYDLVRDPGERASLASLEGERLREARERLDGLLGRAAALRERLGVREGATEELDEEELERLRAIGYAK